MKTRDKILNAALPIVSIAAVIAIWALAAAAVKDELILPSVGETLKATLSVLGRGEFYRSLGNTLLRTLAAFVLSFAAAFLTAFSTYKSGYAARALAPVVVIVRVLPTIAVVLLLVLWTSSRVAAMTVTSLVVFPTLHESLYAAFCKTDKDLVEMARVFKVKESKIARVVVIPSLAPELISAAGAGITLSLKLMVAAEVIAHTPRSVGYMLNAAKIYFEIPEMMALVLMTVVIGLVIGLLFKTFSEAVRKP